MRDHNVPLYLIGVAAQLCGVHPQTLRQYERLGLVTPARLGQKNRLYSEADIARVQRIQRLTSLGVNLAGVEIILRMLDEMEEMRFEMDQQFEAYREDAERRISQLLSNSQTPVRKHEPLLPLPKLKWRRPDVQ
jgi:MerR family transcriptional regulator/heat shock protein HspR